MKLKISPGLMISGMIAVPFSILLIKASSQTKASVQMVKQGIRYVIENPGTTLMMVTASLFFIGVAIYRDRIFDSLMEFATSSDTPPEKDQIKNPL